MGFVMFFHKIIIFFISFFCYTTVFAQLGIGTKTPSESAILEMSSTKQGFLPPRMTTAQRDVINGGKIAEGLVIYNTDEKCLQYWDGAEWLCNSKSDNSGGSGSVDIITKKTIDNSLTQVFAMDDYKSFFSEGPGSEIKDNFHDFAWVNSEQFAIFHSVPLDPTNAFFKRKAIITIYDVNFGKVKEFAIDGLEGWWQSGKMVILNNGRFVIAIDRWTPSWKSSSCQSNQHCIMVSLVNKSGKELKTEKVLFPSNVSGTGLRGLWGLDDNSYITGHYYNGTSSGVVLSTTILFNSDGAKTKENIELSNNSSGYQYTAWSPTSYGYMSMQNSYYKSYSFDGSLIDTVNFSLADQSIMDIVFTTGGKNIIREAGDIIYYNSETGFFKMDAGENNASILVEKKLSNSDDLYKTTRTRWWSIIGDSLEKDRIIYLGKFSPFTSRKVPIGVFPDGSPLIKKEGGYRVVTYDAKNNENKIIKYIAFAPGVRLKQEYFHSSVSYDSDQYNFDDYLLIEANQSGFGVFSNSLKLSPDKNIC